MLLLGTKRFLLCDCLSYYSVFLEFKVFKFQSETVCGIINYSFFFKKKKHMVKKTSSLISIFEINEYNKH